MNKPSNICRLCNKKVNKFDNKDEGFMEAYNTLYHYCCVLEYGYQKFCKEVIEYKRDKLIDSDIKNTIDNPYTLIDAAKKIVD